MTFNMFGRCPPTTFERGVVRARWRGAFVLRSMLGRLQWQGKLTPLRRTWHVSIPYPLDGALPPEYGIAYPRVRILELGPSPHRIDEWLCLFYPWDSNPSQVWKATDGIPRLIEMTTYWLTAYERWLGTPPGPGQLPPAWYGTQILGVPIPDSMFPPWPVPEAPHGIPAEYQRDAS